MAVAIYDRILMAHHVEQSGMGVFAAAAISLATKMIEICGIGSDVLVQLSGNKLQQNDVKILLFLGQMASGLSFCWPSDAFSYLFFGLRKWC